MNNHPGSLIDAMLPDPDQTLLLRASLLSGEPAREAWRQWQAAHPAAAQVLVSKKRLGYRRLMGLLLYSIRRNQLDASPEGLTLLKSAYASEAVRYEFCRNVYREIFSRLQSRGHPFMVLKGVALAHSAYPDPVLRHCHDLDLLVQPGELFTAADALIGAGFRKSWNEAGAAPVHVQLRHPSGWPVTLHGYPLRVTAFDLPLAEWWGRAQEVEIAGVKVKTLSTMDSLQQVCLHAMSTPGRRSCGWVVDAWHLVESRVEPDWPALGPEARRCGSAYPLSGTLGYLADALGAPVPRKLLDSLAEAAAQADDRIRATVIFATRKNALSSLLSLWRLPGGNQSRRLVGKWFIWPDAGYLGWAYGPATGGRIHFWRGVHLIRRLAGKTLAFFRSLALANA